MLAEPERVAVARWNATTAEMDGAASLVDLFARVVERVPNRVAVHSGARWLSYAQLDARANQLASHLRALDVQPGAPVGIALDRSVDIIVAIVAVLKAGAAYVPLLPEVPVARLAQQVTESGARVVVTVATFADRLTGAAATVCLDRDAAVLDAAAPPPPDLRVAPDSTAYVLYTSGSTGVPKGVAVTHANVVHYTRAISRVLAAVPADAAGDGLAALDGWHFALVSTLGADLGNTCLFPALCAGGTLHVLPHEVATDPAQFASYMSAHSIDVLKITPSHLRALLSGASWMGDMALTLPARWLVLGGEALSWDFATQLLAAIDAHARHCRLLNHYGPTETTVGCSTFEVTPQSADAARAAGAQTVPIGHPLPNTTLHVLDANRGRVPVGVIGELYVAGAGVTAGYVNRPELNAERFVGLGDVGRAYRTGDRVRRLSIDGAIEFLGRSDDQVKIRGHRVELGEIEQVLLQHPMVAEGAVLLHRAGDGSEPRLVGYAVERSAASGYAASHAGHADERVLREWLAERLPEYMVPKAVVLLERMPLTPSGKIDRRALPQAHAPAPTDVLIAPRTATEEGVAAIWREVLKKDAIGVKQNFIALGGHSLLAIRVLGKLSRQFGVRLPLRTLFDAPTVEQLAELVDIEVKLAALDTLEESDASSGA
jgi:amino acid adenylation domain-containing protein